MEPEDTGNEALSADFWPSFASRSTISAGALIVDGKTSFVLIRRDGDGCAPAVLCEFDTVDEWEAFVRSVQAAANI